MSTISERPGVYTSYEVSTVYYSGNTNGTVGIVGVAEKTQDSKICSVSSYDETVEKFGAGCAITELIRILIKNGVAQIKAVPVFEAEDNQAPEATEYEAGFELLAAEEDVKVIICDTVAGEVHGKLRDCILAADQRCVHKIGIVEGSGTAEELVAAAGSINSERMVLVGPGAVGAEENAAQAGSAAAAVAGAVVSERDPAIPLNGAELHGILGLSRNYNDSEITTLVRGGVTPVECVGGTVSIVRGITTKTKTGSTTDYTYRELTTVMIIDNIIPEIRDSLKKNFSRKKNTTQTRDAIRTHVIVKLEEKKTAEIIDSYDNITVTQDSYDPTVCNVTFDFTVTHGLNQIRLKAYITV